MFLRNAWYAAWWVDELETDRLQPRMVAGEPVVFWRDRRGVAQAVFDRCPHRYASLSLGRRTEAGLACGYHGIAFDGQGRCVDNPHGPIIPALCVRAFPIVERHKLIWIWMGDADRADPAQIPDLGFVDRAPEGAFCKGFLPTNAGHQLIADNILDLTHADYVHASNLGGGALTRAKPIIDERPDGTVYVEWPAYGDVAPPFFRGELPAEDQPVDTWNSVLWSPNGVMVLRFGATLTGRPREEGIDIVAAHIATPETALSTHYFYMNARDFRIDDVEYTKLFGDAMHHAFANEDRPMIEAQQLRIGDADLFDRDPVLLPIDRASTCARRALARLVEAEKHGQPTEQLRQA